MDRSSSCKVTVNIFLFYYDLNFLDRFRTIQKISNFKNICHLRSNLLNADRGKEREREQKHRRKEPFFLILLTIIIMGWKSKECLWKYCFPYTQAAHCLTEILWIWKVQISNKKWLWAILNFIVSLSGMIYCYVTSSSFLTPPFNYKLLNAPCADEYSVLHLNPDMHMTYVVPGTANVYIAECSLSDAAWHFFANTSPCIFFKFCIANRK